MQGWRTKRVFAGSGGLSLFLLLEAWSTSTRHLLTIDVGSFQVNPDGTQERSKVPSVKSESNVMELLGQKRRWEKFAPRREEKNLLSSLFSSLQWESIVEEYEDEIFSLIAHEADYLADKLCSEKSGTVSDVTSHHLKH
uniref:Canopy FGF signaling regulator 1 n=1 Tax=Athene cunicularia TaxID=194338 RepID=A0A663M3U0_ATHCN